MRARSRSCSRTACFRRTKGAATCCAASFGAECVTRGCSADASRRSSVVQRRHRRRCGTSYPELAQRARHIVDTTRAEEERFLATIEGGHAALRPARAHDLDAGLDAIRGTISGSDAFRLYDTFGFPIDLTELMARERGYTVDIAGFEHALEAQRSQSREERKGRELGVADEGLSDYSTWEKAPGDRRRSSFVGYGATEIDTAVSAVASASGESRRARIAGHAVLRGVRRAGLGCRRDRR